MRRYSKFIVVAGALAALAVPSIASAAPPPPTPISGDLSGQTLTAGNYIVPAGKSVNLGWADVKGNLIVDGTVNNFGQTLFEKNVTVEQGGHFKASNWGVTINGNLSFTDPVDDNGFWGDYSPNEVKGNLTYTIDGNATYQQYGAPYLYFGGGVKVDGNFTYNTGGRISPFGSGGIPAPNLGGLTVVGNTTIS